MQRIDTAQKAIEEAQNSANEETKSSAGDKYETGRAMMQIEIEKNTAQLTEAMKLRQALSKIVTEEPSSAVQSGSLVITNQGNFYIAISAGQLTVATETYFAISPASPIGSKLMRQEIGHTFTFNLKDFTIAQIW